MWNKEDREINDSGKNWDGILASNIRNKKTEEKGREGKRKEVKGRKGKRRGGKGQEKNRRERKGKEDKKKRN